MEAVQAPRSAALRSCLPATIAVQAGPLLAREPKPNTAEADIALAFQQSAAKSTAETDPLFGSLTLRWLPPDAAASGAPAWHPSRCVGVAAPRYDAWDGLYLECAVDWPLQLLFPPEVRGAEGLGSRSGGLL